MKQQIRTFVAVDIDPKVRDRAAELVDELSAIPVDVKWVDPENLHFTLKFLGEVDAREVHHVCQAVQKAVAEIPRFELEVGGLGAFPNLDRPRTIWLGVERGTAEMSAVAERIESALEELGYRREARPFHAHLTLGRVRRAGPGLSELSEFLRAYVDFEAGSSHVAEVPLFSSSLSRSGPTYEILARARLRKAESG